MGGKNEGNFKKKKMRDKILLIAIYIFFTYVILSQFFAVYFWYIYVKNHDFLMSIFVGPFIAEFKGLLWPLFI